MEKKTFIIKFDRDWLKKGDVIATSGAHLEVLKVYRQTWWKKILAKIGFKVRVHEAKVIEHKTEDEDTGFSLN